MVLSALLKLELSKVSTFLNIAQDLNNICMQSIYHRKR